MKVYNERTGNGYSAKEFFEKEYIQTFFNHPLYMMSGGNSPLENPKISWKKGIRPSDEERKDRITRTIAKIESPLLDASVAIGYPASEEKEYATTSGLITDMSIKVLAEDKYLSWIGSGFGCCVKGGLSIFFSEPIILWTIYEGWNVYRKILNDKTFLKIRGNQIEAWNGYWLTFLWSKRLYRQDFDFSYLHGIGVFTADEKVVEVNTVKWSELVFSISNKFSESTLTGYVYSLGQTNKTLGFYPFHFSKAHALIKYYQILFGEQAAINDAKEYESLYGIHIKRACELGSIGLQALEPKNLRKYFGNDANLKLEKLKINQKNGEPDEDYEARKQRAYQKDNENIITYRTYKTWLLAMITKNKEETLDYTAEVAKALLEYRGRATKTDRKNLIHAELLGAKSKKGFIEALVSVINGIKEDIRKEQILDVELDIYKELRDRVHLMSAEDFGYFVVLLKFDYAFAESNS
ncbi:MAG: hypothetical protein MI974_21155 [Chitinophagales bacterium]|nr:hypothetical protein [Chitinophagales bacterium]